MPEGKWRKEEKTGNYTKDKDKDKNANGGIDTQIQEVKAARIGVIDFIIHIPMPPEYPRHRFRCRLGTELSRGQHRQK